MTCSVVWGTLIPTPMQLQGIKDFLDEKCHLRRVQESYATVGDFMLDEILRGWGVCAWGCCISK